MNKTILGLIALVIPAGAVHAATTIDYLDNVYGTAISADGTVLVGNTAGDYETFRWTQATGIVPLGMATVPVLGVGAGIPCVSDDGTRVSATILTADSLYATQGVWTLGSGWMQVMPPLLPDGGSIDQSIGSAWGISGDGEVVVGLYWRPGQTDGSAHASRWSSTGGIAGLGSTGHDSRANACNADGSVVVGWAATEFGNWQPTAWRDGVLTTIEATDGFCEADVVTPDGLTAMGSTFDSATSHFAACVWDWDGATWNKHKLGELPGTPANQGYVTCNDCTPDRRVIVGYNRFFFGNSTGFVWTAATGLVDIVDFAAAHGIPFPSTFDVTSLTAVSDDGRVLVGVGQGTTVPFTPRTFVIHLDEGVGAPEIADGFAAPVPLSAWPNPSRGGMMFGLDLPRVTTGSLAVYDVTGRLVRPLATGSLPGGRREIGWDGRDAAGAKVSAGVYYLRLDAGDTRGTRKLVVVR